MRTPDRASMRMTGTALALLAILYVVGGLLAQDEASRMPIQYGETASTSISNEAFFDHWLLAASAGDVIRVTMTGSDGLAPLIGILDTGQSLQGSSAEGAINGVVSLTYTVPSTGTYTIVATRAGSQIGTTTGSYRLLVENLNARPTPTPFGFDLMTAPFACGERQAAPIFSIEFGREEFDAVSYSIRLYGFEGFQPALRVQSGNETATCITIPADALGDQVIFPGELALTLSDADLLATVQHVLNEADFERGRVQLTVGNFGSAEGRFAMIIGGFRIEPAADFDLFEVQLSPTAAESGHSALMYAVGVNNRLDPRVQWAETACDDAGRRTCADVPPIFGSGVVFNEGISVLGDRFDAGVRLDTDELRDVSVVSFGGTTRGEYAVLVYG